MKFNLISNKIKLNFVFYPLYLGFLFITSYSWRRIRDFYYYKIRSEIFFQVLLVETYVSIKIKYPPLYVRIIVDESSLTSYDNFMVARLRCAFKLIVI